MNVILGIIRRVPVNNAGNVVDMDAPCRDIGCNEHICLAPFEILQGTLALCLTAISVDDRTPRTLRGQLTCDTIGAVLRATKEDDLSELLLEGSNPCETLVLGDDLEDVLDVGL